MLPSVRGRLILMAVLVAAAMMSACWCFPAAGPSPEPVPPLVQTPPAQERGLGGVPDTQAGETSSGAAEPTPTPVTFIVGTPEMPVTIGPDAVSDAEVPDPATIPPPTTTPPLSPQSTPPTTPTPRPARVPPPAPVAPATAPAPAPSPTPPFPGPVDITLAVNAPTVAPGQRFSVAVVVAAGPSRPVDAVQVYLEFDAAVLEVESMAGGGALPWVLQSGFDNHQGRVSYAAGAVDGTIADTFTLVTVDFRALAPTGPGGTSLTFAPLEPPRQSRAAREGNDATGNLIPASVVVQ